MINKKTKYLACCLLILLLATCYEKSEFLNTVSLHPFNPPDSLKAFQHEIILYGTFEVRGGWTFFHNGSLKKYTQNLNHFIYSPRRYGKIEADSLYLKSYSIEQGNLRSKSNMKGFIEFFKDSILINLQVPYYKDGVNADHWENFKQNGKYKVITNSQPSKQIIDTIKEEW